MNAIHEVFGQHIRIQDCFFHLSQNTWRKIQSLGLQDHYNVDDDFRLFCGMLDGLAFLPVNDVPQGMQYLKQNVPDGAQELIEYFDETYVSGSFRRIRAQEGRIRFRRIAPRFPPEIWNVSESTLKGGPRTNNHCEAWNNGFLKMAGQKHPSFWRAVELLQLDTAVVATDIMRNSIGDAPQKRVKKTAVKQQQRLRTLCTDYASDLKSIEDFLRGVGHNIRF